MPVCCSRTKDSRRYIGRRGFGKIGSEGGILEDMTDANSPAEAIGSCKVVIRTRLLTFTDGAYYLSAYSLSHLIDPRRFILVPPTVFTYLPGFESAKAVNISQWS
jgi:hypothetical protein